MFKIFLLADILPRNSEDIQVIAFKINGKDNKSQKLKDRSKNIESTLARLTGTEEMVDSIIFFTKM